MQNVLKRSLGCCHYPTTVLMVDDNPRFLTHLSAKLDPGFHFKLMTDPREASLLANQRSLLKEAILSTFVDDPNLELESEIDNLSVYQNHQRVLLGPLLNLIQNPARFDEISVIIVDYAMPGMNGLELCRALAKHPAKKILLTGEADHRIAVDAFNEGLIHRFILKQTQENLLYEELNSAIHEMQNIYFSVHSRKLLSTLGLDGLFSNTALINFFGDSFLKRKYMEFYLLNARGALLTLDETGNIEVFVCETAKTLSSYALMAQDNDVPDSVVKALESHTHLPYLLFAENEDLPFDQWENYLLPAVQLEGTDLFYAVTSLRPFLPEGLEADKIQNYANFIEQHLRTESSFK